jgi:DNA polymerase I-like protein with 3'-5' exonuclease and polymerase domains
VRFDSMLESYVWNSTATRHEIDAVVRRYLGFDPINYEDLTGPRRETDPVRPGRDRRRNEVRG